MRRRDGATLFQPQQWRLSPLVSSPNFSKISATLSPEGMEKKVGVKGEIEGSESLRSSEPLICPQSHCGSNTKPDLGVFEKVSIKKEREREREDFMDGFDEFKIIERWVRERTSSFVAEVAIFESHSNNGCNGCSSELLHFFFSLLKFLIGPMLLVPLPVQKLLLLSELDASFVRIVSAAANGTLGLGRYPPFKREVVAIASAALDGFKNEAKNMVVALVDMERAFVPPQHFIRLVQRRFPIEEKR